MKKQKIGISLRGGGSRAASYIGMLKAFEEEHIEIDFIIGSSGGAYVGGLYGAGISLDKITEHFSNQHFTNYFGIESVLSLSVVSSKKTVDYMRQITEGRDLKNNKIKTFLQTSHIKSATSKVFESGDLAEIIFASSAVPVLTVPYELEGELYIDGDVTSGYGVDVLRKAGAHFVLAATPYDDRTPNDIYKTSPISRVSSTMDISMRNIRENDLKNNPPDILLRNLIGNTKTTLTSFKDVEMMADTGYKETRKRMPEILEAMRKRRGFGGWFGF